MQEIQRGAAALAIILAIAGCGAGGAGDGAGEGGAPAGGSTGGSTIGSGGQTSTGGTGGAPVGTGGVPAGTGGVPVGTGGAPVGTGGAPPSGGTGGVAPTGGSAGQTPIDLPPVTLFIAGDSTVMTYTAADPLKGWGQEISQFFTADVTVNNLALGGRSSRTFMYGNVTCVNGVVTYTGSTPSITGTRWERIVNNVAAGDYVAIQFGTNDAGTVCERHVDLPEFQQNLGVMADAIRAKSATPIFVTPMSQLSCSSGTPRATLTDYATAMKEAGQALGVEVVDLNALSIQYYESVGCDYLTQYIFDGSTHFQEQGAIEMARLVTEGLTQMASPLAAYLVP
jgi:lysophospholipase L1-like esterase